MESPREIKKKMLQLRKKRLQLQQAGDWEGVIKVYEQMNAITPDPIRYTNSGLILTRLGRLEEARRAFERALELKPGFQKALDGLAKLQSPPGSSTPVLSETPSSQVQSYEEEQPTSKTIQIGGYVLQHKIGEGGAGSVYKATDALQREVAVKLIKNPGGPNSRTAKRFLREVKILARLSHPNIVTIWDAGAEGEDLYLAMEFLPGKNLKQIMSQEPLPLERALQIVRDIAQVIEFTHQYGILHRDIKPENIILTGAGTAERVVLVDFGIAKDESEITVSLPNRRPPGTLYYLAPELVGYTPEPGLWGSLLSLFRKSTPKVPSLEIQSSVKTDIYAVGALLYALLTGSPPYYHASSYMQIIGELLDHAPPNPRKLRPSIPKKVEAICLKAMMRDARKRYVSAGEIARDIDNYFNPQASRSKTSDWRSQAREHFQLTRPSAERTYECSCGCGLQISSENLEQLTAVRTGKGYYCLGSVLSGQHDFTSIDNGRYWLLALLEKDRLGAIYEGIQSPPLKRKVLVKIFKAQEVLSPNMVKRIHRGLCILAKLPADAPVMRLYDFRQEREAQGTRWYYVTEDCPGRKLETLIYYTEWMTILDKIYLLSEVARALEKLHQLKIIHRNIKPANILVTQTGQVKITDFTLSKRMDWQELEQQEQELVDVTLPGKGVGVPYYMAPEQINNAANVDLRVDLWALGVIAYELLTREKAFGRHGTAAILEAVVKDHPEQRVRRKVPDIPQALYLWLKKAMAKPVQQRFQSATEMRVSLEEIAAKLYQTS